MSALTIANIDPETEAGLRRLAKRNGRTLEAEIADLLAKAATAAGEVTEPAAGSGFGSRMRAIVERHGGFDLPESEPWSIPEPIDFSGPDFDR